MHRGFFKNIRQKLKNIAALRKTTPFDGGAAREMRFATMPYKEINSLRGFVHIYAHSDKVRVRFPGRERELMDPVGC